MWYCAENAWMVYRFTQKAERDLFINKHPWRRVISAAEARTLTGFRRRKSLGQWVNITDNMQYWSVF